VTIRISVLRQPVDQFEYRRRIKVDTFSDEGQAILAEAQRQHGLFETGAPEVTYKGRRYFVLGYEIPGCIELELIETAPI
jgi:hypothetical protein